MKNKTTSSGITTVITAWVVYSLITKYKTHHIHTRKQHCSKRVKTAKNLSSNAHTSICWGVHKYMHKKKLSLIIGSLKPLLYYALRCIETEIETCFSYIFIFDSPNTYWNYKLYDAFLCRKLNWFNSIWYHHYTVKSVQLTDAWYVW